ncbi:MAG: hypothetical protein ACI3ZA_01125, partial [Alloprevotella sp.]
SLHRVFHSIRFKVNKVGIQRYPFFYARKVRQKGFPYSSEPLKKPLSAQKQGEKPHIQKKCRIFARQNALLASKRYTILIITS